MVRKRNKNRKKSTPAKATVEFSTEVLTERARCALQNENFKEAIGHCKALIKDESRPERLALLAKAYHGRARALADKGMHKEAVMIWRNRTEFCATALADPFFFRLLAAVGQLDEALALFNEQRSELEQADQLNAARELFAALAIAGFDQILSELPDDDPVLVDYPAALAALQAYCEGDDKALQQQLKAIPFRSPFRDLRQLLKALISETAESTASLIQRIPETSAFISLAQSIGVSLLPDEALLSTLNEQTSPSRSFVLTLKGWHSPQAFINELTQLDNPPSPEAVIRLAARHQQLLGEHYVTLVTSRLAIHSPNIRALLKRTKSRLNPLPLAVTEARRLELKDAHPIDIFEAWGDVISLVKGYLENNEGGSETKLILALIYRHVHELEKKFGAPEDVLLQSLQQITHYDPEDKSAYLQLIPALRSSKQLKEARRLLEQALSYFPDDMAILTEAVETALAGNAFKKAAGIARQILAKDPINQRVRQALIDAHLAHCRKQINQKKYTLAEKELAEAGEWAKSQTDGAKVGLVRGVLQFKQQDYEAAAEQFKSATEQLGGALCGRFFLLLELSRQNCNSTSLLKQCKLEKSIKNVELPDLLALLQHLDGALQNEAPERINKTFKQLKTSMKQCARLSYTFDDGVRICETLQRYQLHELRQYYAKSALKHWRNAAVYIYHELDAEAAQSYGELSDKAYGRLKRALMRAENDGDKGLTYKLQALTEGQFFNPFNDFDDDDDLNLFGNPFNDVGIPSIDMLIDLMLDNIPPHELKKLEKEMGKKDLRQHLQEIIEAQALDEGLPLIPGTGSPKAPKKPKKKNCPDHTNQTELF